MIFTTPKLKPIPRNASTSPWITQRRVKKNNEITNVHTLLHLQRTIGNRATGNIIQAQLKVGQPRGKFEQEADQVAEEVLRLPEPHILSQ